MQIGKIPVAFGFAPAEPPAETTLVFFKVIGARLASTGQQMMKEVSNILKPEMFFQSVRVGCAFPNWIFMCQTLVLCTLECMHDMIFFVCLFIRPWKGALPQYVIISFQYIILQMENIYEKWRSHLWSCFTSWSPRPSFTTGSLPKRSQEVWDSSVWNQS